MNDLTLAFFGIGPLGGWEMLLLAVLGLLIFGSRLPDVGRSLGATVTQFKKGLQGLSDEMERAGDTTPDKRADEQR